MLRSVYSGHQSILIPPAELETNPALWLLAVSQYKVRDTFCSYSVMELCTKGLGSQTESLKVSAWDTCQHPRKLRVGGGGAGVGRRGDAQKGPPVAHCPPSLLKCFHVETWRCNPSS